MDWYKACKKKDLITPQWLRNIKDQNILFLELILFF